MRKLTIARVTEEAIKFLQLDENYDTEKTEYSCNAVYRAARRLLKFPAVGKPTYEQELDFSVISTKFNNYIAEMGCNPRSGWAFEEFTFSCFKPTQESQDARVLWLAWVHMMAVEEGV